MEQNEPHQSMEQPPPHEGMPLQFTGQQLLQQALAHHQAMAVDQQQQQQQQHLEQHHQQQMEQQQQQQQVVAGPPTKEGKEQTPEQAYQDVYHRLWKGLQAKVEDYHRTMTSKTGEMLPSDYWGAPPQVLIVTVSPFGKIYQHASEAFKGDEHLKTMAQGLTKVLQSYQSQAIVSSRVAAQTGLSVAPQFVQKGKQRKKSDFSRQQALFGSYFRNKLMPQALAALAEKIREASQDKSEEKRKEISSQCEEAGFLLHKDKGCENGCNFCQEFRRVVDWPPGIPLMKNPAAYQKVVLYQLCHHYNLQLQDLPPPEQGKEGAPAVAGATPANVTAMDEKQRMTPGLEALLGVAEAHAKEQTAGDGPGAHAPGEQPADLSQAQHPPPEEQAPHLGMPGEEGTAPERGFAPVDTVKYENQSMGFPSLFAHFKAGPGGPGGDLPPPNPLNIPYAGHSGIPMGMEMPAGETHHHHILPQAPQLQLHTQHPTAVEPQQHAPVEQQLADAGRDGDETEEDQQPPSPKRQKTEEA